MSETVECAADQHKIFQHTADRETAEVDTLMKTSVDGGALLFVLITRLCQCLQRIRTVAVVWQN